MENIQEIQELLVKKDYEGAKTLLHNFLTSKSSKTDDAESFVLLSQIYMKITNSINEDYSAELDASIKKLEQISKIEKDIEDAENLHNVRKDLK